MTPKETSFINHLMLIEKSNESYKERVDFDAICQAIIDDGAKSRIEQNISHNKLTLDLNSKGEWNKYDDWDEDKISSIQDESYKYFLMENQKYKKMICFLERK